MGKTVRDTLGTPQHAIFSSSWVRVFIPCVSKGCSLEISVVHLWASITVYWVVSISVDHPKAKIMNWKLSSYTCTVTISPAQSVRSPSGTKKTPSSSSKQPKVATNWTCITVSSNVAHLMLKTFRWLELMKSGVQDFLVGSERDQASGALVDGCSTRT